jgi:hypothetical protein
MNVYIFKNGASIQTSHFNFSANPIWYSTGVISSVVVLNGSTDYVEAYGNCDDNSGNPGFQASPYSRFGASGRINRSINDKQDQSKHTR